MMSGTPQKILFVDDDPILRELVIHELKKSGFECLDAESGAAAWKIIENQNIDCLITDLAMEDSSGVDLIDKVRNDARFSELSIVIASGVLDITPARATEMGAKALFIKPFLIDDLVKSIQKLS